MLHSIVPLAIYFAYGNTHVSVLLSQFVPPSPSLAVSISLFPVFVSTPALQIGSPVTIFLATKRSKFESIELRWMNLEPVTQSEVSQKEKDKYHIQMHMYGI